MAEELSVDFYERSNYFIDRLQEVVNPNNEIEFDNYVSIGGLLELTRQYATMPPGVKELSANGLKDSILSILEKHGTLLTYREMIPIKELREPLMLMFFLTKLKHEKYITKLFNVLSQKNAFVGIMRTINHVIKNGIQGCNNHHEMNKVLDDLIFLLIEYLEFKGHTLADIHRFCKNKKKQSIKEKLYDDVFHHLKIVGESDICSFTPIECLINIRCKVDNKETILSFTKKQLENLVLQGRIKEEFEIVTEIENLDLMNLNFTILIYKLDETYLQRLLKNIYSNFEVFIERTRFNISVNLFTLGKGGKKTEVKRIGKSQSLPKMRIKHFDNLWRNFETVDFPITVYEEMIRINEWVSIINKTTEKQVSFNALWSIMEFLLVDSVHENKIDSICKNFMPYMGLFYYRKILKTFFKKLINMHGDENSAEVLTKWIEDKIMPLTDVTTVADTFCVFLFKKELRNLWWEGIDFKNSSNSFVDFQTDRIHLDLNKPSVALERFESIVKSDLRQMYRLRNMITHSGINDLKILNNTYDRLKYYVETLLNAIAYAWKYSNSEYTVLDLNDFKRIDWQTYKDNCNHIAKLTKDNVKGVLTLVNYEGVTKIPPNRFSFLSSIGKDA